MDATELRQFTVKELNTRIHQWRDELFRAKFKAKSTDTKDTSIFKKLRRDIARGMTILSEKTKSDGVTEKSSPTNSTEGKESSRSESATAAHIPTVKVEAAEAAETTAIKPEKKIGKSKVEKTGNKASAKRAKE